MLVQFIEEFLMIYDFKYIEIENKETVELVYDLYYHKNENIKENVQDSMYYFYVGRYFLIKNKKRRYYNGNRNKNKIKNVELMKHYYLMAIDRHNSHAMNELATHYFKKKQFVLMKHYFLMAINLKNSTSMYNLANHYYFENDFEQSEKYYLMAIESNHHDSFIYLVQLYEEQKKYNEIIELLEKHQKDPNVKETWKRWFHFCHARETTVKREEECSVCYEVKDLIQYDCISHYYCKTCYLRMNKCAFCKVPKHPYFEEMFWI